MKYIDYNTHSAFRRKAYERELTGISVNCNNRSEQKELVISTKATTTTKKSSATTTSSPLKSDAGSSRTNKSKRTPNPAVKRLVDWYYDSWKGMPPEKLNGNGAGRIAKIFSDLLACLATRDDLSVTPEEYIRKIYGFYRSARPSSRDEHWLFGEKVKSLVRFRGKFAYIEGKYSGEKFSKTGEGMKPSVKKDWGVSSGMLRRNKRRLFADTNSVESNNRGVGVARER